MTETENREKRLRLFRSGYMLGTAVSVGDQQPDDETLAMLDDADFLAGYHAAGRAGKAALEAAGAYYTPPAVLEPLIRGVLPDPVFDDGTVRVYQTSALAGIMALEASSLDGVICDPPYSSGGAFRGDRTMTTTAKYVQTGQALQFGDFSGDNRDQRSYLKWCELWISECLRVVKPGGIFGMFTDWRQLPVSTDALQAGGFVWRGIVPWNKTEAARPRKGAFRNQCEYLFWGSNGAMRDEGECLPGLFTFTVGGSEKHHIAGKPEKLMQEIVKIIPPGGILLDCFAGSSTTLKAAREMGRSAIGFDINETWTAKSAERLAAGERLLPLNTEPEHEQTTLL